MDTPCPNEKAVEIGKANKAEFDDRAKALTRCAKAYQKKGDLETSRKEFESLEKSQSTAKCAEIEQLGQLDIDVTKSIRSTRPTKSRVQLVC